MDAVHWADVGVELTARGPAWEQREPRRRAGDIKGGGRPRGWWRLDAGGRAALPATGTARRGGAGGEGAGDRWAGGEGEVGGGGEGVGFGFGVV